MSDPQTTKPKFENGQIPCECGERTLNECANMPERHCGLNNGTPRTKTAYTTEEHPFYNLLGAYIDIKRQWKDADPVCLETIARVLEQIRHIPCQKQ